MKKLLLLSLFLCAVANTNAQQFKIGARKHLRTTTKPISLVLMPGGGNDIVPLNSNSSLNLVAPPTNKRTFLSVSESSIGLTDYDLQTNESIQNRLLKHSDGTLSATWTFAPVGSAAGFPLRGTGYNYFDGSNWGPIPTTRLETINRSGWPNVVVTASNKEVIINHSNTAAGILMMNRSSKGIGAWAENPTAFGQFANDTWAKAIKGGANGLSIHSICQGSGVNSVPAAGQVGPLYYSRSTDEGVTWPILRTVIPATDSMNYNGFSSDSYSIDTKGDTVVIVVGSFITDLLLLKSFDNGTTWNSQVIQPFFQPLYDPAVDSFPDLNGNGSAADDFLEGPSGDACILIDKYGKIHVWWSNVLLTDSSAVSPVLYYPNSLDGLLYWNDGFLSGQAPDTIAYAQDGANLNGVLDIPQTGTGGGNGMGSYRGSITQMPSAGVDASNNLFVSYQSYCEDCDTSAFNTGHKHVYIIASQDQGATWGKPFDVDQSPDLLNQEDVFACLAKEVDPGCIHLIYQRDGAPGHKVSGNANEISWNSGPSEIIYACVPPNDVLLQNGVSIKKDNSNFHLSQNSPNPAQNSTTISYTLATNSSQVTLQLRDVLGNVVYLSQHGKQQAGTYTQLIDTENLSSGVYFYTINVDGNNETKKMMVK